MRKKCKKLAIVFLNIMMLFSALVISRNTIHAIDHNVAARPLSGWQMYDPAGIYYGQAVMLYVDNEPAFCLEPGKNFFQGNNQEISFDVLGIGDDQRARLDLIAYFGYRENPTDINYQLTWNLIWKELGAKHGYVGNGYPTLESQVTWQNEVLRKVDRYYANPDFGSHTFTVTVNEPYTISDTNNLLSDMYIASTNGLDATIEGNSITIIANSDTPENSNIILKKRINKEAGTSFVVRNDNSQAIAVLKTDDPYLFQIRIKVNKFGSVELMKEDERGNAVENLGYMLSYHPDMSHPIGTFLTNKEGKVLVEDLEPGTIYIQEVQAPNGIVIDPRIHSTVIKPSEVAVFTNINERMFGTITLHKEDIETGNVPQGDASMIGATYELRAKEPIMDPITNQVLYQQNDLISTQVMDKELEIVWTNLEIGSYYIQEVAAPLGYLIDANRYDVMISPKDSLTKEIHLAVTSKEQVKKQPIEIIKTSTNGTTGVMPPLAGAKFVFKLESDVNISGWDTAKTYDEIITDSNGWAKTIPLPYGTYLVKETETPNNEVEKIEDFIVVIDEDNQEPQRYLINNAPLEAYVKIVKKEYHSNQTVTLNQASFQIFDDSGNIIKQKVGDTWIDTFTTDETGTVTTPLRIPYGTYFIKEVRVPTGMLQLQQPITFEIKNPTLVDEDNNPLIIVEIKNEMPIGNIKLKKSFQSLQSINEKVAAFELYALLPVISPIDGHVIYRALEKIPNSQTNDGLYYVKENEVLEITDLPLGVTGATYVMKEISTTDGYLLHKEPIIYNFTIVDDTTKTYEIVKEVENIVTTTTITKVDATTGNELPGAELMLLDATGNIIEQWISTDEPHVIYDLIEGNEYTLVENLAPIGYEVSQSISFVIGEDNTIIMEDMPVLTTLEVIKINPDHQRIINKDFSFGLYKDKACTEMIEEVFADTKQGTVQFKQLRYGTYYIKEIKAPDGYQLSDEIKEVVVDNRLEGVGKVHSLYYSNQLKHVPLTADNNNLIYNLLLFSIASYGLLYMVNKRRYLTKRDC